MELIGNIIGYIAAGIGATMFFPQVMKSWKTKQTKDLSWLTYSLLTLSAFLWIIYGLLFRAGPIIFVNTVIFLLSIFMLILKSRYG